MTKVRRASLFLVSSLGAGVLYIGILYALKEWAGMNTFAAVSIAYGSAMTLYFLTNKQVVFGSAESGRTGREVWQFLLVVTFNYFLTLLIVVSIRRFTGEPYSGSVVAGIVTTTLTYFLFDKVLFAKPRRAAGRLGH